MKKYLMMFGATGLLAAMIMVGGCGGGGGDSTPVVTTTTSTTAATTTTTAAPTTTTTTTTTLPTSVSISAAGTSDAAGRNATFTVGTASSYSHTINNFTAGDKIVFPVGNLATVLQDTYSDGYVTLQYVNATTASIVKVVLTGISSLDDGTLNFISSINTLFGPNTVTYQ